MSRALTAFRATYGASPWQVLGMALTFGLALVAAQRVYEADSESWWRYAIWFVGAAVVHDLVLFPAYAALDRGLAGVRAALPRMAPSTVNYVRVPTVLSGLLLLVFGAAILQRGEVAFTPASGLNQDVFAGRWLLITAVLFLASGLLYLVRGRRSARTA